MYPTALRSTFEDVCRRARVLFCPNTWVCALCPVVCIWRAIARTNTLNQVHLSCADSACLLWIKSRTSVSERNRKPFCARNDYIFSLCTTYCTSQLFCMTVQANTIDESACVSVVMWLLREAVMRGLALLGLEQHKVDVALLSHSFQDWIEAAQVSI